MRTTHVPAALAALLCFATCDESGSKPGQEAAVPDGLAKDGPTLDSGLAEAALVDGPARERPLADGPSTDGPTQDGGTGKLWAKGFGSSNDEYGYKVAVDGVGNITTTGHFCGTLNFGGGPFTCNGVQAAYLASFSSKGVHRWSKSFGSTAVDYGWDIAVDGQGNVTLIGEFNGSVDFGGGTITSNGAQDVFVASYSSTGAHRWSKGFGSAWSDQGVGIGVDGSGNVTVAGRLAEKANLGGGQIGPGILVASFSSTGAHRWSKSFGDNDSGEGRSVATDGSGNVTVTGKLVGSVTFGGGTLTSHGYDDIFVASFDSSGTHRWSKSFGSSSDDDWGRSITSDASGNVTVTGEHGGTVDFGGGALANSGSYNAFVASFSSSGAHRWSKTLGGTGLDVGMGVAADASGNVTVTGGFEGAVDFGGGTLTGKGYSDIFVARYSSTGAHLWSKRFGGSNVDYGTGIALDASGNVAVTGWFSGTVDFGAGPLASSGFDIYLLWFTP